jgi:hypothetical protein
MIKKFNEFSVNEKQEIKKKNIQETIDEILDNLSAKGELSESEKEFMEKASKDEIIDVSIPNLTGNFWSDMSNPHNLGTLYLTKEGIWKELKSLEDEDYEKIDKIEDSDERWNTERKYKAKKAYDNLTDNGKKYLDLLITKEIQYNKEITDLYNKIKKENPKFEFSYNHEGGLLISIGERYGDVDYNDSEYITIIVGNNKYKYLP